MRQKPLQWLLNRALAHTSQAVGERTRTRARTIFSFPEIRVCSSQAVLGTSTRTIASSPGTRVWSSFPEISVWSSQAVLGTTTRTIASSPAIKVWSSPWDFRPHRSYAAPVPSPAKPQAKVDRKVNRSIVARMIRLVEEDGHEVLSRYDALLRAQQAGLDLVEVDGRADPPVCKLMDFSKERFKVKKQEKDLRKKQLERRRLDDLKEVRFSSRTEQKDLEMKAETVTRLLYRGHRVKVVVQFHGNDKGDEVGVELLERALKLLETDVKVENGPRVEKMRAWVMIRPVLEQKPAKKMAPKTVDEEEIEA